jgi:hypothetical protein
LCLTSDISVLFCSFTCNASSLNKLYLLVSSTFCFFNDSILDSCDVNWESLLLLLVSISNFYFSVSLLNSWLWCSLFKCCCCFKEFSWVFKESIVRCAFSSANLNRDKESAWALSYCLSSWSTNSWDYPTARGVPLV